MFSKRQAPNPLGHCRMSNKTFIDSLGPHVVDPEVVLDAITLAHNTSAMKSRMISSLHWYVNQSLTDMLDDYMIPGDDPKDGVERQQILAQIVDLPIGFDERTRQLVVTQVLDIVKREILTSKGKCMELIIGLFRRLDPKKSEVGALLLKEFENLVEHVLFEHAEVGRSRSREQRQESTECVSLEIRKRSRRRRKTAVKAGPEPELLKEAIVYIKIFIKIYRLGFFRIKKVPLLVILNKLSLQRPNYYFANLLIYILKEVGASLIEESRFNGNGGCINILPFIKPSYEKNFPTIDNVFKRVAKFYRYVPPNCESLATVKKLVEDRNKAKTTANQVDYVNHFRPSSRWSDVDLSVYNATDQTNSDKGEAVTAL